MLEFYREKSYKSLNTNRYPRQHHNIVLRKRAQIPREQPYNKANISQSFPVKREVTPSSWGIGGWWEYLRSSDFVDEFWVWIGILIFRCQYDIWIFNILPQLSAHRVFWWKMLLKAKGFCNVTLFSFFKEVKFCKTCDFFLGLVRVISTLSYKFKFYRK